MISGADVERREYGRLNLPEVFSDGCLGEPGRRRNLLVGRLSGLAVVTEVNRFPEYFALALFGLTIIAIGTSLPEAVTAVIAEVRMAPLTRPRPQSLASSISAGS